MNQQEISNYFSRRSEDEDCPINIDPEISMKYQQLEQLFNSFFPNDSLSIAKEKSKEERDTKRINDSSFTYGETVNIYFYNKKFLDISFFSIHF